MSKRPILLCILDGWGHSAPSETNAISLAKTPHWDALLASSAHCLLDASAGAVGLPEGQMGNSEVGHTNIGAGRVVMQDLPKIDRTIADGSLAGHPRLKQFIENMKRSDGVVHLMGLLSDGGVHSHQRHMLALAGIIADEGVDVQIHAILDGRDTPPKSALAFVKEFEASLPKKAKIVSVCGRYFVMDRDNRWDRVEQAYQAIVRAQSSTKASSAQQAIQAAYTLEQTDEFIAPVALDGYAGMKEGDGLLMANFRADRARQMLHALVDPDFTEFERDPIEFSDVLGMVEYSSDLARMMDALFPPEEIKNSLGEVVAKAGLRQLRIAETEKYAHVTFFFNGGSEAVYDGEDRILVPSPKVATYDLQPEMSAPEVTQKLVAAIESNAYDLIVCNYANTDMVGHSGDLQSAIKAVEAVDEALGKLYTAVSAADGILLITADHGNAEKMQDDMSGQPHTAHTTNLVPFVVCNAGDMVLKNGVLADIAPTILSLMQQKIPKEMTGSVLMSSDEVVSA